MLENISKSSDDKVFRSEMDDGGRCLLDVINDPQLLQSFLDNSNTTPATSSGNVVVKKDDPTPTPSVVSSKAESAPVKKEVKAKKSSVVATKSSPGSSSIGTSGDLHLTNGKVINTLPSGGKQQQQQPVALGSASAVGVMPLSLSSGALPTNAQSVVAMPQQQQQQQQPLNSANSSTIRAPTPTLVPQTQFQLGPRSMTVLPQQLLMPGMQMAQPGISQFLLTSRPQNPSSAPLQAGQVLQIIQTSQGAQILPANPATSIQQMAASTTSTASCKTSSSSTNSRFNKQILPKPLGSSASASSTTPSKSNTSQANSGNIKLIQQQPTGAPAFNPQSINASSGLNGATQFVIGSGPQGTFLLNNSLLPNIGSQPFLFQGNGLQNHSVQLAIRPQAPLFVNNNSLGGDPSNISIALANNAQVTTSKPTVQVSQQQQTFVFSNTNTTSVSNSNNHLLMGPNLRSGAPNFFIRPQFTAMQQQQPAQPQFLQIQTANGPILVALNSTPQMAPQTTFLQQQPQAPSNVQQQTIQLGNTVFSLAANPSLNLQPGAHPLQTILTQPQDNNSIASQNILQPNIATSSSSPLVLNNSHSTTILPKSQSLVSPSNVQVVGQQSPKTTSLSKGLNLADLLKETGILSDFSPPTSPKNSSVNSEQNLQPAVATPIASSSEPAQQLSNAPTQSAVLMVQNAGGINGTPNLLLAPNNANTNSPLTSNLRFTIAPDGTLLLVSPNTMQPGQVATTLGGKGPLKDSSGIGSSQPSPDSTTPSIDTATSSPSTSVPQSVSSLINLPPSTVDQKSQVQTPAKPFDSSSSDSPRIVVEKTAAAPSAIVLDNGLTQLVAKSTELSSNLASTSLPVFATRSTPHCDTVSHATTSNTDTLHLAASNSSFTSQKAKAAPEPGNTTASVVAALPPPPPGTVTLADVTGVPILQVSAGNKEFMGRLDAQLRTLLALKNPSVPQQELLHELTNVQQRILQPANSLGLAIQLNLSQQAQQLLQLSKPALSNTGLANSSASNSKFQSALSQNQHQNGLQLVSPNAPLSLPQTTANDSSSSSNSQKAPNSKPLVANGQPTKTTTPLSVPPVKVEPERPKQYVPTKAIHQQLNADQNAALHPDCKMPFRSRDDAFKRLLRYHVFDWPTPSAKDLEQFDEAYENLSQLYLRQKSQLYDKFRYLLLQQSMKESASCEHVMLERLFVQQESKALKADRELVASGKVLDLPPPPDSWLKVEAREDDAEISRKRKFSTDFEDDFDQSHVKKEEIADICNMLEDDRRSSLRNTDLNGDRAYVLPTTTSLLPDESQLSGSRNRDIDSVDQLIDQLNSQENSAATGTHLLASDHQSFLDSLDSVPESGHGSFVDADSNSLSMVTDDLETLYSDIQDSEHLEATSNLHWSSPSGLRSGGTAPSSSIERGGLLSSANEDQSQSSRMSWSARFSMAEAEAAVAVQSIINSNEDTDLSVDLSGIDDNSVNFDDVVPDGNGCGADDEAEALSQQQQGFDVQMHCAINSIMMHSPSDMGLVSGQQSFQYSSMDSSLSGSTSYSNLPYHMSSQMMPPGMRANNLLPYQSSVADTMLDEAVKSIL